MSLSAALFGSDSFIHKATNILGLGIPGWLDKQFGAKEAEPQIRTLGELSQQTAKEAEPRPIIWGRVRPIGGNLIHCQAPVIRLVTTTVEGEGGKGGSKKKKQKQTSQHVYRTYAIGVCEGPITGYTRIWRNNKLVYDARGNEWGQKNNGVFLKQFRLYLGNWDQMPDPTLEAIWGVGNVPAYRGTAYIVSIDEDLTDLGGSVPQFIFEVERAEGRYYTSKPYALEDMNAVDVGPLRNVESPFEPIDLLQIGGLKVVSGMLREPIVEYDNWPYEALSLNGLTVTAGTLRSPLVTYDNWPYEALDISGLVIVSATLRDGLVDYNDWPFESVTIGGLEITEGSLT